jgi:hypothetical protein
MLIVILDGLLEILSLYLTLGHLIVSINLKLTRVVEEQVTSCMSVELKPMEKQPFHSQDFSILVYLFIYSIRTHTFKGDVNDVTISNTNLYMVLAWNTATDGTGSTYPKHTGN